MPTRFVISSVLALIVLAACAPSSTPAPTPQPTATVTPGPTASPTPEYPASLDDVTPGWTHQQRLDLWAAMANWVSGFTFEATRQGNINSVMPGLKTMVDSGMKPDEIAKKVATFPPGTTWDAVKKVFVDTKGNEVWTAQVPDISPEGATSDQIIQWMYDWLKEKYGYTGEHFTIPGNDGKPIPLALGLVPLNDPIWQQKVLYKIWWWFDNDTKSQLQGKQFATVVFFPAGPDGKLVINDDPSGWFRRVKGVSAAFVNGRLQMQPMFGRILPKTVPGSPSYSLEGCDVVVDISIENLVDLNNMSPGTNNLVDPNDPLGAINLDEQQGGIIAIVRSEQGTLFDQRKEQCNLSADKTEWGRNLIIPSGRIDTSIDPQKKLQDAASGEIDLGWQVFWVLQKKQATDTP